MCEPISATLAIVSAAASAYGTYSSEQSKKQQASYEAKVAEQNAALAYQTAGEEQRQAEDSRRDLAMRALQEKGNAKAQYAASGLSMGGGSFNDYMNDIANAYGANLGRLDYDVNQKTGAYLTQAFNYNTQAQASRAQARAITPGLSAFTSGIQGAASGWQLGQGISKAWKGFKAPGGDR